MNAIHKLLAINEKELQQNIPDKASWHADYNDTSYIYIGNLHESLKEKDILAIFSQYGNPTHINMVKDRDSGRSRGFCYLKYEDQRSCVLAIDNFNGVLIYERPLKVDHTYYKLAKGQIEDDFRIEYPKMKQIKDENSNVVPTLLPYGDSSEEKRHRAESNDPSSRDRETNVRKSIKVLPISKDDDFSDPMAFFKRNNDFSDPMATLMDDDNFDDPMAPYVKPVKAKEEGAPSKNREREPYSDENSSRRSKRHHGDK